MKIERKIDADMFRYDAYFPKSKALEGLGLARISYNIIFQIYALAWLEQLQLEKSTKKSYTSTVCNKLIPYFGGMAIKDIIPFNVRQYVTTLSVSPKYIKNIIGVLSAVMSTAKQDGIIDKNPCENIKLPKVETVKVDAINMDEAEKIINYTKKHNPQMTLFFAIGFYMGLRTGEIMALQWGDFDFNLQKLTVTANHDGSEYKEFYKDGGQESYRYSAYFGRIYPQP